MFFPISTTPAQFRWLADQLRASRAIIDLSQKNSAMTNGRSGFGNTLVELRRLTNGEANPLCSQVNIGMLGFPLKALLDEKWKTQFQYRATTAKGIAQYPGGDLWIAPMKSDGCLHCTGLPQFRVAINDPPITSLMFRLDLSDRVHPQWMVEPHQNIRPVRIKHA